MSLSSDAVRALERHFVGALSLPSRLWLDRIPLSHLVVSGNAVLPSEGDGCTVDFGVVESPGTERQVVRIASAQPEAFDMKLDDHAPWLAARWLHAIGDTVRVEPGGAAELELTAAHDVLKQTDFAGCMRILVGGARCEELPVRMVARRTHPLGAFDFHGSPHPRGFDFGVVDSLQSASASFDLAFDSLTSMPLIVAFADLPAWLTFEVDGHRRVGPAAGRFFERAAPFHVSIRPHCTADLVGTHHGALRLETNDPRPELRSIDIRFSLCLEPAGPFLRAFPAAVRVAAARPLRTEVRLENWGRTVARIAATDVPPSVQVLGAKPVPPAQDGHPGVGSLALRVLPARLVPGRHSLPLTFEVAGGTPLRIALPIEMPASARTRKRVVVPAAVAVLFALLAFTVVIVLYLRVLA